MSQVMIRESSRRPNCSIPVTSRVPAAARPSPCAWYSRNSARRRSGAAGLLLEHHRGTVPPVVAARAALPHSLRDRRRGRVRHPGSTRRARRYRDHCDGVGRRWRHLRHRAAGAVGRSRAQRELHLRLLRQRGVHEHRHPALVRHTMGRLDHHNAGEPPRSPSRRTSSPSWRRTASRTRPPPPSPIPSTCWQRSAAPAPSAAPASCTSCRRVRRVGSTPTKRPSRCDWRFTADHPGDPIEPYIRAQGRFRHLDDAAIERIQRDVDSRWEYLVKQVG
jgi:hypothetical protein